nr:retrotransposon Gag domain, retroviral aspartyl protease [Tanacetum cinerariifolium]
MVQTRNSENNNPPDPIATQLAALAAKLEAIETMKEDIATLKEGSRSRGSKNFEGESSWMGREQYRPYKYNKIDFPIFSGGDPRGWLLKAEKYLSILNWRFLRCFSFIYLTFRLTVTCLYKFNKRFSRFRPTIVSYCIILTLRNTSPGQILLRRRVELQEGGGTTLYPNPSLFLSAL